MKTSHNTDARGPALCVKCYNLTRDVPADAEGSDDQQRRAYDDTARAWWHAAELIAQRHGFRKVWATGRMGGWLYTEPMPEPPTDDDGEETGERAEYPPAFVAELSELLNRAPEMYAEALAAIIADDADNVADLFEMGRALHAAGYYVGPRDPERNRTVSGEFMIAEALDVGPTDDASAGGFCIVGDDLAELIREACDVLELPERDA